MTGARDRARVWVLSAGKPGDDAQAVILAEAVGWPHAVKRVGHGALEAPWPDIVIAFGRVTETAARAVAAASGRTRIVQLGRPHGPLTGLDLVVGLPQYRLPDHPRVVRLTLPLQRVNMPAVTAAAAAWAPPSDRPLPRPWIAVLVGGPARPYALDAAAAQDLGRRVSEAARTAGGSLLVTTSRRTPHAAARALAAAITAPAVVHHWSSGDPANPYLAFLGVADWLVVTADSASMLADAVSTGKPVEIFPLPRDRSSLADLRDAVRGFVWRAADRGILAPVVERLGIRPPRDLAALHARLCERGLAAPFGAPRASRAPGGDRDELAMVAARVRALVATEPEDEARRCQD